MSDLTSSAIDSAEHASRLSPYISHCFRNPRSSNNYEIGVLRGEGIGTEVIDAALSVLSAIESVSKATFTVHFGGCIGNESTNATGHPLSNEVISFCEAIFARHGSVLSGPGGGRYVYDLRKRFDLFCKLNPIVPRGALDKGRRLKSKHTKGVDITLVRENVGGIYQGQWAEEMSSSGKKSATHHFSYSVEEVKRIVEIAAKISAGRQRKLAVIVKPNGIPTISDLWLECAYESAAKNDVEVTVLEVDYAVYHLIQHAPDLDVIVTPNLFGDILSDLGGVLLGSRGLCYAGSFSSSGASVYQTNHGAAFNLAGTDRANPVAQILSLAMMLGESFGLIWEADLITGAIDRVWRAGFRTDDIREPNCRTIGTSEMGNRIAQAVFELGGRSK